MFNVLLILSFSIFCSIRCHNAVYPQSFSIHNLYWNTLLWLRYNRLQYMLSGVIIDYFCLYEYFDYSFFHQVLKIRRNHVKGQSFVAYWNMFSFFTFSALLRRVRCKAWTLKADEAREILHVSLFVQNLQYMFVQQFGNPFRLRCSRGTYTCRIECKSQARFQ